MPVSRRRLLQVASLGPILLAGVAARDVLHSLTAAARSLRPRPDGTTATRCAACGAAGHAMLQCPSLPRVLRT